MRYNANPHGPIGDEAASILGVSRRTVYRWLSEGRLTYPLTYAGLAGVSTRRRGPERNPMARRYTVGRHRFEARSE